MFAIKSEHLFELSPKRLETRLAKEIGQRGIGQRGIRQGESLVAHSKSNLEAKRLKQTHETTPRNGHQT